ncbi:MAG: AbrB/MazE/SpoVT family DNA-binding domain-containing protein [Acidobacteria bacterium]|nr:AbrB/MazE/SpoVT family DNA-binding domain-containing protein [Acidobacteriota bacterium]
MQFSKITTRGQTTIPKRIREAANLHVGDVIAFEIEDDHLVVRKVTPGQDNYLKGFSEILNEWSSPEDEEAWRNL